MSRRAVIDLSGAGWRLWFDREAVWRDDELHPPGVALDALPTRPPSGGWRALAEAGTEVQVPSDAYHDLPNAAAPRSGVSWWQRRFLTPGDAGDCRVVLRFERVDHRAEVFLDGELVGYDAVGDTPFEIDITSRTAPGREHHLAVRVTRPERVCEGAREVARWGAFMLAPNSGLGGLTGPVGLVVSDCLYIDDLFVKNLPSISDVEVELTVRNVDREPRRAAARIEITEVSAPERVGLTHAIDDLHVPAGASAVATTLLRIEAPRVWSLDDPALYRCRVTLDNGDERIVQFGLRWFATERDAHTGRLHFNGRRIVLRGALSYDTRRQEAAAAEATSRERLVQAAKQLGFNFIARCDPPSEALLSAADRFGVLVEAHVGAAPARADRRLQALALERIRRRVRCARQHPSLIGYTIAGNDDPEITPAQRAALQAAQNCDVTRAVMLWSLGDDDTERAKARATPYEARIHVAGVQQLGPTRARGVYRDAFYRGPGDFDARHDPTTDTLFFVDRSDLTVPPADVDHAAAERDGASAPSEVSDAVDQFLEARGLRRYFPTVGELSQSIGNVAYYYLSRMLENARIGNQVDAYAIDRLESSRTRQDGLLDAAGRFRGDPRLFVHVNQPLYVAVKLRDKVIGAEQRAVADFHLVNETHLHGVQQLTTLLIDLHGVRHWLQDFPVTLSGAGCYGELLVANVELPEGLAPGVYIVRAELRGRDGRLFATGHDELFVLQWRHTPLPVRGALLDPDGETREFVEGALSLQLPEFTAETRPVDYLVFGDWSPEPIEPIPPEVFLTADGRNTGLTAEYFRGGNFDRLLRTAVDPEVAVQPRPAGATMQRGALRTSIRWTGVLRPPSTGTYVFHADVDANVRCFIDEHAVLDEWTDRSPSLNERSLRVAGGAMHLEEGRAYDIAIEFSERNHRGCMQLLWSPPQQRSKAAALLDAALQHVQRGATLLVLQHADRWASHLAERGVLGYRGRLHGGGRRRSAAFFVRQHALFRDLPVNQAMNWPYQELVDPETAHYGLLLDGVDTVVGMLSGHEPTVGDAVAIARHGAGRVVLSTLDLTSKLRGAGGAREVARKLLCNFLVYAGSPDD